MAELSPAIAIGAAMMALFIFLCSLQFRGSSRPAGKAALQMLATAHWLAHRSTLWKSELVRAVTNDHG